MSEELDLMEELVQESMDHMETIEPDFLEMEEQLADTSEDLINRIFRAMHSIKGGFGFVAKAKIVELAHVMENVLMRVRDGEVKVTGPMVEALISGTDTLRKMIEDVEGSDSMDISEHLRDLAPFTKEGGGAELAEEQGLDSGGVAPKSGGESAHNFLKDVPEECRETVQADFQEGLGIYLFLDKGDAGINETFINELNSTGNVLYHGKDFGSDAVIFSTVLDRDMVECGLDSDDNCTMSQLGVDPIPVSATLTGAEVEPAPAPAATKDVAPSAKEEGEGSSKESASAKKAAPKKSVESIRVRTDILNNLIDTAGELILGRNRVMDTVGRPLSEMEVVADKLQRMGEVLGQLRLTMNEKQDSQSKWLDEGLRDIERSMMDIGSVRLQESPGVGPIFQNFSQISSEIQNGIMGTRLQPVGAVFSKFPRVIRDMNRKLGKEIDLQIEGEDVELDKSVIEGLGDPLTHLVRNSADHGVETPDVREQMGKPRKGIVLLQARHEGGQVHIVIRDDGGGIDPERMRKKAAESGMMSREEAYQLTDKDAQKLIFAAGFSTAKEVTDVSGRGVGMDVVRTNIENLGGRIDINSKVGEGTTLTLIMPLTLAIIPSLEVGTAGRHFAIPQVAIEELVRVSPVEMAEKMVTVGGEPVLKLRDELLPVVDLAELLEVERVAEDSEGRRFVDRRSRLVDRRSEELNDDVPEQEAEDLKNERHKDRRSVKESLFIVVLHGASTRYGLAVDKLLSPQEVVVKPLSNRLKEVSVYAGATIRSDGSVAMILDADGIAREANIREARTRKQADAAAEHANIREAQTMLEFGVGTGDLFSVNLSMVARVEQIDPERLQKTGDREFLRYDDSSLPIIRLENHLPIGEATEDKEELFVLVPRLVPHPIGIAICKPKGIFETDAEMDSNQMSGGGIHGTQVIDGRMVIFLDLYALFEKAMPDLYEKVHEEKVDMSKHRVLLAEDTALFRTVMGDFLRSLGFGTVDVAENGQIALNMLEKEPYDLLVTDIVMPEMDGIQLTKALRRDDRLNHIKVIAVTSLMNESDKKRILDSGVDSYQQKLDKDTLSHVVMGLLGYGDKEEKA